ncbi:efflux RND transporter periplasmic adaptor subunit [Adonisia turfae]|uniref:Efflux RND transporter periplasmic adaptor subunit n=1 Tax=Adonisia turfae CCMR0081 TaxID=2292702 RepID=A0A6M0RY22_9CYAN|nr:efflux RND transporter periplasmic adaptor subunit [Adonisia turfae]NEZ60793.1 efflux RND transporter periplasmic adaptor subunit [Adonisia turfae CCMR0081]
MKAQTLTRLKPIPPWSVGIVAVGLVGAIAFTYIQQRQPPIAEQQTVFVKKQDLNSQIQASGVVQAERVINLSPEDSGKIAELFIQEGDFITQGHVIARMTSRRSQAEVEQYRAVLAETQATLEQQKAGPRSEEIAEARARVAMTEASIKAAQTRLQQAQQQLARFDGLAKQGAISADELDSYQTTAEEASANLVAEEQQLQEAQAVLMRLQNGTRPEEIAQAEAAVAQAQAQLTAVQVRLDETVVRAPFDGIITRRFAEAGDFVSPATAASSTDGAASTSIAELSSGLEIEAKVPEASIAKLAVGQTVEVRSSAYPNEVFSGEVKLIAPRAIRDNQVTVFQVKVLLKSGQEQLKSGMNVRLIFIGQPISDALVIPLAAVVTETDGTTGVYAQQEDGPTLKPVQLGPTAGTQVQVMEGLAPGDEILIEPPADQRIDGVDNPF